MDRDVDQTTDLSAPGAPSEPLSLQAAAREVPRPVRPGRRFTRERRSLDWLDRQGRAIDSSRGAEIDEIREGQRTDAALERDSRIRRALAVSDVVAAAMALGCAIAVAGRSATPVALLALPFVVLFCKLGRLYDRDEHVLRKTTLDQAPALVAVATIYTLTIWLTSSAFVDDGGLTKAGVAVMWPTLILALVALRSVARLAAVRTLPPERILVLGSEETERRLRHRLETAHSLRGTVIGRVPLDPGDHEPEAMGILPDLDYVLRRHRVERVIIAPSSRTSDELLNTIRVVKALGVKVSVLPRLFEVVGSSFELDDIDGITMLGLRRYGLSKTSWFVKRSFDLAFSITALVLLAPLMGLIALAIRLTSPGPTLFRQPRVGRRGERFHMFKFRTMYDGADEDKPNLSDRNQARGLFKIVDDPRVTPVGRLLRRMSLDELPQLINVVRGEMSLVGPRPLVEEEDRKIAGWHHRRREGTPGMTGVWQVLGPTRVSLDDMVKLDYLYRANWSLWLDAKILLRTVAHVVSGRGV